MQVEVLKSPDSSCDSFKTSEDKSDAKPSWKSSEEEETTEDVTFQPSHPVSLDRAPSITPSIKRKDEKLNMSTNDSSAQAAQIIASETNPLSIQSCPPLSVSSSNMIKRIVENQNLLIWQAYDDWRQKFPRLQPEEDEDVEETELESETEDELLSSETLAVEA
ncbi:hypothetical protein PTTG_02444 [Puccinia triticina 1-1 BBBD Race 1]|uniref:Uncharacterized protein n=1 Tax=Puccinia triticina (isolate 1-1 / race 1 (BBBD)) TaxID=630390 RepID=A0A0C4ENU7_PUCT1|nr:hypothetical protein PTTG_02444 [Puccinia triticina 1-1 BBBD Race 1]WAR54704.1 hypothetical protein PtB15_4B321 [Puccinia triticina]